MFISIELQMLRGKPPPGIIMEIPLNFDMFEKKCFSKGHFLNDLHKEVEACES